MPQVPGLLLSHGTLVCTCLTVALVQSRRGERILTLPFFNDGMDLRAWASRWLLTRPYTVHRRGVLNGYLGLFLRNPLNSYSDTSLCLFPEITSESTQSIQCTRIRSRAKGVQRAEVPNYRFPQSAIESSLISICSFPTDPVSISAILLNSQA